MAINPLQAYLPPAVSLENGAPQKARTGSSPFNRLLDALGSEGSKAAAAQPAAAELLRIEMMQNSLSLFGEADSAPPSGLQALESLLGSPASRPASPGPTPRTGVARSDSPYASDAGVAPAGELADPEQPADQSRIEEIGETAAEFLGTPYRFGGEGAQGIDCSSFVQQVFREHEVELPRTAREQIKVGREVAAGDLKKGDLVFFQTYASYPSHVGIYLGEGKMIHASSGKGEVTVSDLNSDYYRSRFLGAKRVA